MNKILSNIMLFAAGALALTSCSDDNDSNPTLIQPTEFVLNTPTVSGSTVDLALSKGIDLSWSQPKYTADNAPIVATYSVQISTAGTFNKEYNTNAKDDAENEGADFVTLDETTTECKTTVDAASIDKAIQQLNKYEEDKVPAELEVSIRMKSDVRNASLEAFNAIESNVVKINMIPYYFELKNATPVMWYLVGNMFGGKWGSDIGDTALPMFLKPDFEYDKKTGTGEIEYTNYFVTGEYSDSNENGDGGFKIQPADFIWDYGMTGDNGKKGTIIYRNGGGDGGHILAPENGYYTITMNTEKNTATMTKYEGEVKDYGTIQITGSFNDWADTPMLPYNTAGVENHAWYYVMTVTPDMYNADHGVCEFKFKIAGSWDTNWGFGGQDGAINMYGKGEGGKSNLGLKEGKYVISFNDITGAFSIVQL